MKQLKGYWKGIANGIGLSLSVWFLLDPRPYPMALFVFLAHPLFCVVILAYLRSVWRDLRRKQVL